MSEVSHTNPHGDPSVTNRPFQRGPVVAADGGRRGARDEDDESDDEEADATPMRDVDHTPPYGDGEEVDRVFERGGSEEPVETEE